MLIKPGKKTGIIPLSHYVESPTKNTNCACSVYIMLLLVDYSEVK